MKRTTKYVALDVHQATTVTSVREESGRVLARSVLETHGPSIVEFFRGLRGAIHVVFEEGTQAQWLYDLIARLVDRVVCDRRGQARHGNKADHVDADQLSELLRRGGLRSVYHGSAHRAALKELTRAYRSLVEDGMRVMLRIEALFRARAIPTRGTAAYQARRRAPKGLANAIEALVLFVRNDIAIANIGPRRGAKFAPYILTLFFFILYSNLLGLLPFGATATGNLAVTGALALTALLTIEVSGMVALGPGGYLRTIVFVPPGVKGPMAVLLAAIMIPVELIGKIVKPFALMLRLFANMTAGHFVILSLLGIIFLFGNVRLVRWLIAGGSVVFVLFMMALELLIALLQAYIFALLTSVFIGLMQHEH